MRYRNSITYILVFFFICLFSSCQKDACFNSKGKTVTFGKDIEPFEGIEIQDIFEVYLEKDTVNKIEITGGENLVNNTDIYVRDNVLYLYDDNKCNWLRDYEKIKVVIHYNTDIRKITVYSPAFIGSINPVESFDLLMAIPSRLAEIDMELNCDKFFFYTHTITSGTYKFKGIVHRQCDLYGYYASKIIADSLFCPVSIVKNYSIADCYVRADSILIAEIYSKGNIYYYGNPVVYGKNSDGKVFRVDQ